MGRRGRLAWSLQYRVRASQRRVVICTGSDAVDPERHIESCSEKEVTMKKATEKNVLFELTHAYEEKVVNELHEYFDWAYLNN